MKPMTKTGVDIDVTMPDFRSPGLDLDEGVAERHAASPVGEGVVGEAVGDSAVGVLVGDPSPRDDDGAGSNAIGDSNRE